jgi:hypothetical protein
MVSVLRFFSFSLAGLIIILLLSLLQSVPEPIPGEYFYSGFLRNNYTVIAAVTFFLAGLATGYFIRPNPWLAGLAFIFVFPLAAVYEAAAYRGSHNLIPFELVVYFFFSLPVVAGVYAGKYLPRLLSGKKHDF